MCFLFIYIVSAYSNLSAVASSTFMSEQPSYVLDGVYGKGCNAFSSVKEENPWLEMTWTETITIWRIIIYNRLNKKGMLCSTRGPWVTSLT